MTGGLHGDQCVFCSHATAVPNYNFLIKFKLMVLIVIKVFFLQRSRSELRWHNLWPNLLNASNEKAVQVSFENPFNNSHSWSHQRNVGIWLIACGLKWAVPDHEAKIDFSTWNSAWSGFSTCRHKLKHVERHIWCGSRLEENISLLMILMGG